MASSEATSTAAIEPAVHTNLTGGNKAKSSATASKARTAAKVFTMQTNIGLKAMHGGYWFTFSSQLLNRCQWRCDFLKCGATLKTKDFNGQHYLICAKRHNIEAHKRESSRPSEGCVRSSCTPRDGPKRKADSSADKRPETINTDGQVPTKKSTSGHLSMASDRQHSQDTPQGKAEDTAGDNSKIESAKVSFAGILVDSPAAADRPSPVHFQHPRGSDEPGTSAWPSGHQGAQESEILPPPTPPARPDHADSVQNDADDGDDSYCISSDDSMNGDVGEKPGAIKHEAGDVNSRDAKAGVKGSLEPAFRIASYESTRNGWNATDDSARIALTMHGLGSTQIVLNMSPETGDPREKELRVTLLQEACRLLKAQADWAVLRIELLSKGLYSNMTDNAN
ncbi:uncharacterized protein LOC115319049 [Ixodes scapularis]|uniref:uncharacterized protein LOC115319049 n=1 Tax=Ixodes scapularis TaxID=6945 RepID=UPI001A9E35B2|nr:uncharacterized protein LOC115319049 [Ixodes scapularis]